MPSGTCARDFLGRTPNPMRLRTGGCGLALVAALADHWDTVLCPPGGKTVRAEPLATTTSA